MTALQTLQASFCDQVTTAHIKIFEPGQAAEMLQAVICHAAGSDVKALQPRQAA
jgi:hypothetical protein